MSERNYCDRMSRRDCLKIGTAMAPLGMGLSLSSLLQRQAAAAEGGAAKDDVSLIVLFLKGGLSTIDTLDLKPHAPSEFRGDFNPIATNVPGIEVCEHLPLLARQADKFALRCNTKAK